MSDLIPKLRFNQFTKPYTSFILNDKCNFYSGGTPTSTVKEYYGGNIPFIKSGEISSESTEQFLTQEGLDNSSAKMVSKGDLLYALYGATSGQVAISKMDGAINQAVLCIKSDNINLLYLNELLKDKKKYIVNTFIQGGQGNLSASIIKNLTLNFPSLEEQTKIAEFLTSVDKQIELLETKKSKLNTYKSGLMQKLFSQELRFKDDNGNDYPEWETKTIKQLGKIYGGGTPSTSNEQYWNGSIPWISSSDIENNDIHNIKVSRYINEQALKDSATKIIEKNNLLIISRVGVGKFVTNSIDVCTSQDFSNLVIDKQIISNKFLAYYLLHNKNILFRISQGTTIKGFTNDDLYKVKINTPLLDEQTKIAEFLTSIDQQIDAVDQQIKKTQSFKKGLLQQMFV